MSEGPPTRDDGPSTTAPAKPSISDVAAWLRRTAEERDEADVGSTAPDGEAPSPDPVPPAQRPSGTTSSAMRQASQPGGGGASVATDGSEPPRPDPDRIEPRVEAVAGRAAEPPSPPRPPEHPPSDADGPAAPPAPEAPSEDVTLEEVGQHHPATGPFVLDERSADPENLADAAPAAPAAPAGRPTAEPEVIDAAPAAPAGPLAAEPEVIDAGPAAPARPPTPAVVAAATAPPAEPVDEADRPAGVEPGRAGTAAAPGADDREAVTAPHPALDLETSGTLPADRDDVFDELWPPDRTGEAARDDGSGSKAPGEPSGGQDSPDPEEHATDVLATAAVHDTDRGRSALRGIWGDVAVEPPEAGAPPGPSTPAPERPMVPAASTAPGPSTQVLEPPDPAEARPEPAEAPAAEAPASQGDQFDLDLARMLDRARARALARPTTAQPSDAGRVAIDDHRYHDEGRWDDRPNGSQVIVRAPQPVPVPVELQPVPDAAPRTEWDLDSEPTGEVIVVDPPVTETPARRKVPPRTSRPTRPTYPRGQLKERIGILRRIRAMLGVVVVTVLLGVAAGAAIGAFLLFLVFAIRNAITSG